MVPGDQDLAGPVGRGAGGEYATIEHIQHRPLTTAASTTTARVHRDGSVAAGRTPRLTDANLTRFI